jgi:octaprenyl-diphosphate synthase
MTKPTLIQDIQSDLAEDLTTMNQLILKHLNAGEELIEVVSKHLIEAGGKRIRPLLTILTSKMFGYSDANKHNIKLASAVEFIHTATLLHDDVIDSSRMRRFRPTANTIWGNKESILVGDFLFSQSFRLMVQAESMSALYCLSQASVVIVEGEVTQLTKLKQRRIISRLEYEDIIAAKTAELFGAACEVGAVIANQPVGICQVLRKFGIILGNIFQITDDLLDYLGDSKEIGKNTGNDFFEGKVTLPLILLAGRNTMHIPILKQTNEFKGAHADRKNLHEHRGDQQNSLESSKSGKGINSSPEPEQQDGITLKLQEMIEGDARSIDDFAWVQAMLEKYKIKQEIIDYLDNLKSEAEGLIQQIKVANIYKDYLHSLVQHITSRIN